MDPAWVAWMVFLGGCEVLISFWVWLILPKLKVVETKGLWQAPQWQMESSFLQISNYSLLRYFCLSLLKSSKSWYNSLFWDPQQFLRWHLRARGAQHSCCLSKIKPTGGKYTPPARMQHKMAQIRKAAHSTNPFLPSHLPSNCSMSSAGREWGWRQRFQEMQHEGMELLNGLGLRWVLVFYFGFITSGIALLWQSAWETAGKERSQSPTGTGARSS